MGIKQLIKRDFSRKNAWQINERKFVYRNELDLILNLQQGKSESVLDAGAGRGRFSLELSKRSDIVVALDISKEMLFDVKSKCKKEKKWNVLLICGDAEYLPFKPNSFDLVIAAQVIGHLSNPSKSIRQINNVLKYGKKAILSTGNLLSIEGLTLQLRFLILNFKILIQSLRLYQKSRRKFWLKHQGHCRDTIVSLRNTLRRAHISKWETFGISLIPSNVLSEKEILGLKFPFNYFCRLIIISFRKENLTE